MSNVLAGSRSSCSMIPVSVAWTFCPVAVLKILVDALPVSLRPHPNLPTFDVAPVSTKAEGMDPSMMPRLVSSSMSSFLRVSMWEIHSLLSRVTTWLYY